MELICGTMHDNMIKNQRECSRQKGLRSFLKKEVPVKTCAEIWRVKEEVEAELLLPMLTGLDRGYEYTVSKKNDELAIVFM